MDRNTAHESLRASRVDTGARAPAPRVIRYHAGHALAALAIIAAAAVSSQHIDALAAFVRSIV